MMYGTIGPTRRIRYDAAPEQLQVALELDLGIEHIVVTRSMNEFCACFDGYEWTITFASEEGDVPTLVATSHLTGTGASIGDGLGGNAAAVLIDSPTLSGTFVLKYDSLTTSNLAHDIDAATLTTRLTTDLGLSIHLYVDQVCPPCGIEQCLLTRWRCRITRSGPDPQGGYTWSITFQASTI